MDLHLNGRGQLKKDQGERLLTETSASVSTPHATQKLQESSCSHGSGWRQAGWVRWVTGGNIAAQQGPSDR